MIYIQRLCIFMKEQHIYAERSATHHLLIIMLLSNGLMKVVTERENIHQHSCVTSPPASDSYDSYDNYDNFYRETVSQNTCLDSYNISM